MAIIEVVNEPSARKENLRFNWFRVRNLFIFLGTFIFFLLVGVVLSLVWPVKYTSRILVTEAHAGLQGDLNWGADILGFYAGLVDNSEQLDAMLRLTPENMLTEFGMVFSSSDSMRNFYIDGELYKLDGFVEADNSLRFLRSVGKFVNSFSLSRTDLAGIQALELAFTDRRSETAAELLNNYVQYAADKTVRNLVQEQISKQKLVTGRISDYLKIEVDRIHQLGDPEQQNEKKNGLAAQLEQRLTQLVIDGEGVRPMRFLGYATADLAKPTPEWWAIVATAAGIGLLMGILALFLLERREHDQE